MPDTVDAMAVARAALPEPELPRARLAREMLERIGTLSEDIAALDREITCLVTPRAPPQGPRSFNVTPEGTVRPRSRHTAAPSRHGLAAGP